MAKPSLVICFFLLSAAVSCKQGPAGNSNQNSSPTSQQTSTRPPFSTKEPARYQATRIITTSRGNSQQAQAGGTAAETEATTRTTIARDADKRREDYEYKSGLQLSFLQLPKGLFLLVPSKKIYTEVTFSMEGGADPTLSSYFSTDRLVNESRAEAHYEKLGTEQVNGRTTTKYRVTAKTLGTAEDTGASQALIWVDESLGMPIKNEISSPEGDRFTRELQDIKQDVDPSLFELPPDYRKVDVGEIRKVVAASTLAAAKGLTGSEK